ncbi:hypothetical protein GCM10023205_39130 [Yinghuangia aomiensis]|uniref:Uncharacterized protein n=1 Tax=Yinghuangia aomiensis TaxID=676205 RepID=A0ABP9HFZ3_9ACTN
MLSPARNAAPDTVRTPTNAAARKAPESALALVPEARGWLRGLAANPAAPESVRDRLRAAGRAADAPPALTLAGLADAVRATPDAAALRVRLGTSELPDDLAEVALRSAPTDEETVSRAAGAPWRETVLWAKETKETKEAKGTKGFAMHDNVAVSARSPLERRRSAATAIWMPDFDTAALAADPDFTVRMLLAWHHTYAPLAVRQEAYATWADPAWQQLGMRPGFRADGLVRFAAHPRPYARMAALDDPAADFAALSADPSPTVRWWARRNRHLPWQQLRALLVAHPEDAAANPGLPPEVMHRLLDIAAIADVPPVDTRGPSRRPGAGSSAGS